MKLYHGTKPANLPAIKEKGLIPCAVPGNDATWSQAKKWNDQGRSHSVYLTPDPDIAAMFACRAAKGKGVVLTVDLPENELGKLTIDEAGGNGLMALEFLRFEGDIPPAWIVGATPTTKYANAFFRP